VGYRFHESDCAPFRTLVVRRNMSQEVVMIKLGFTLAAAAGVLAALVVPVNAGCKTITKSVETDDRTVTQKTKVCDNSAASKGTQNRPAVIVVPLVLRPIPPRPAILLR
jgi:hypothetical protein